MTFILTLSSFEKRGRKTKSMSFAVFLLTEVYRFQIKFHFHIKHSMFEIYHAIVWYKLTVALNMPPAGGSADCMIPIQECGFN